MLVKPILLAGAALIAATAANGATLSAPPVASTPSQTVTLAVGRGQMVRLSSAMTDLFVASDAVADVQVRSPTQLYLFGKAAGETTIYATNKSGQVVYSANVRVGANYDKLQSMLDLAMPDQSVKATTMNGVVLLSGTVATPQEVEEAATLVQAFVGKDVQVVSRIKTATPLQVNLRVRIAEVNRAFAKSIGFNILTGDSTGGFKFGMGQGQAIDPDTMKTSIPLSGSVLNFGGKLFGLDVLTALDLAEDDGLSSTLAEPNLTALSGETASFLAGGEIPIPVPQYQGVTTISYKPYGVSLSFSPVVLSDGRISMRVAPEVSQLTTSTVRIDGYTIPGISTRKAETTVELGSGQSFVIGGLLSNNTNNTITKAPFLGDLPILGALFRSTGYTRNETELVIVVTPYLVKPVSASRVSLPTDGHRVPNDGDRMLEGQIYKGVTGAREPKPTTAPPTAAAGGGAGAAPGFSFN